MKQSPYSHMTAMFFEDFAVGQEYALPPVTVTMERMLSFARQYDPLPLHLDAAYAETTVFGGLIAPGIMRFMIVWAEFVKLNLWSDNSSRGKTRR